MHTGATERSAILFSEGQEILTMATITAPELPDDEVVVWMHAWVYVYVCLWVCSCKCLSVCVCVCVYVRAWIHWMHG